ncbi:MAG: potassium channel family protein [Pseudomonadota bacterium]
MAMVWGSMLLANLLVASAMVTLTVLVHFLGLVALGAVVKRRFRDVPIPTTVVRQSGAVLFIILSLFGLHTIEIWLYAGLYMVLGEFQTLESALYFSTSTFTTVGFGDLYLDERWRLLSAIQSANGFLLIGWSTAYLVSVMSIVRDIDRDIAQLRKGRDEQP